MVCTRIGLYIFTNWREFHASFTMPYHNSIFKEWSVTGNIAFFKVIIVLERMSIASKFCLFFEHFKIARHFEYTYDKCNLIKIKRVFDRNESILSIQLDTKNYDDAQGKLFQ